MKLKKKPRFFCDNCGHEVGNDTKACPQCGRFFASIRCPSCGFTGEDKLFIKGCPSCGYSDPSTKRLNKNERSKEPPQARVYFISIVIVLLFVILLSYLITR